eukprot:CAMPEP_0181251328 /NCGR_PEP_ID=MMETSP1096-20121128/46823_1 /TAXON_ID=156174 ORGANISM="Chrysochromulina ericina, Strain CCMP281" /NCGR_SAMPLE_ID=MMETSP1096 /ASSEMBLY_ACC=CAM_ASM_000453 /LENGTH=324 /DNA_ID=CAMNT_0023348913 /DNA_START=181 /DNA_END=1156 /DNA_ORIENTATION=+
MNVFLSELQWHALNNILTTTYFLLLLIHLQANTNPTVDIVLRYAAFTAVWIAQIKDEYWNPWYTALVVAVFCMMPVCKFCGAMRLPPYEPEKLLKGAVAGVASAVCFVVGLDDQVDPFRLFHGLSQALVGLALYYLWQLVPLHESEKKIEDPVDPKLVRDALVVPGMGARAMSGQDLPLCTVQLAKLEYYWSRDQGLRCAMRDAAWGAAWGSAWGAAWGAVPNAACCGADVGSDVGSMWDHAADCASCDVLLPPSLPSTHTLPVNPKRRRQYRHGHGHWSCIHTSTTSNRATFSSTFSSTSYGPKHAWNDATWRSGGACKLNVA